MNQVKTLNSGDKMPVLGLGTALSGIGELEKAINFALKAGYRHFDCAHVYQNEAEIGDALAKAFTEGLVKREDVWITSKLWNTKHAKEAVLPALAKTLSDLKLEYLDLYLIHFPVAYPDGDSYFPRSPNGEALFDDSISFIDTYKELEKAKESGLIKNIGLSNFNSEQIESILSACSVRPAVLQIECHPYLPQFKLKEVCEKYDIAITGYSPLGSPEMETSKLAESPKLLQEPKLVPIAEKHNKTVGQILIRYQIERGNIVIPKSVNEGRINQIIDVFNFKLDSGDMEVLNNIGTSFRYIKLARDVQSINYPFSSE